MKSRMGNLDLKLTRAEIDEFREKARGQIFGFLERGYWVYALVAADRPIYVGQTSNPESRFHNHLKVAYGGRAEPGQLRRAAVKSGQLLSMVALVRLAGRIEALAYESAWARQLRLLGHELENTWSEHTLRSTACRVPLGRLWDMSFDETQNQGIRLEYVCAPCGVGIEIPGRELAARMQGNPTIRSVRSKFRCPTCGAGDVLKLQLSDEAQKARVFPDLSSQIWPPATYSSQKLPT